VSCERGILPCSATRKRIILKRDNTADCYAVIRYNSRTYQSAGTLLVVRGKETAESELKRLEECQDSSDRHDGWRYFIEKTDLTAGTDPVQATQHRQDELEARELKALQEDETSTDRSQNHRG
jgi:hypothetical protein